jgi:hypothetical protein
VFNLLKVVQPQPQARSSIQEDALSPHSPVVPQTPVVTQSPVVPQSPVEPQHPVSNVLLESHMIQTPPTEEDTEDTAGAFNAVEDTGYSAIALYDYQAGGFFLDF